jgi:hypothetical protein
MWESYLPEAKAAIEAALPHLLMTDSAPSDLR